MNASKALLLVTLIGCIVASASMAAEIALLSGTCHNVSGGADGLLKLAYTKKGSSLEGYLSVSGWLGGSGPLTGSLEENKIRFQTRDPLYGMVIDWQGVLKGSSITGEYVVEPNAAQGTDRQVGEWSATLQAEQDETAALSSSTVQELLKLVLEVNLNAPVKQADGTMITGAQNVFQATHPIGQGVSINVESVDVDWNEGSTTRSFDDIYKFRATYVLYWQGLIRPTGWTRLRLAYNAKLGAVTAHEIIESTGTTKDQFNDIAFGVGVLLGKAMVDSWLNSK